MIEKFVKDSIVLVPQKRGNGRGISIWRDPSNFNLHVMVLDSHNEIDVDSHWFAINAVTESEGELPEVSIDESITSHYILAEVEKEDGAITRLVLIPTTTVDKKGVRTIETKRTINH